MFETHEDGEVSMPELGDRGKHWWNFVQLSFHLPWFHVAYQTVAADSNVQVMFLPHIDQLIELSSNKEFKIIQVDLVSPGHVNDKGIWKMEPIKEILYAEEPNISHEQTAFVYVVLNGDRYVFSMLSTAESELLNVRTVFKHDYS